MNNIIKTLVKFSHNPKSVSLEQLNSALIEAVAIDAATIEKAIDSKGKYPASHVVVARATAESLKSAVLYADTNYEKHLIAANGWLEMVFKYSDESEQTYLNTINKDNKQ